jgi:aminopeptidase N
MRAWFIITLFFGLTNPSFSQPSIDVLHYTFNIKLNDQDDTIYGVAEIQLKFLENIRGFDINVDLLDESTGKGMMIDSIRLPGGSVITPAMTRFMKPSPFYTDQDKIKFVFGRSLDMAFKPDTSSHGFVYAIFYHGLPSDGLIISKNRYGDRTFFADNWPNRAHNWIPCVDDPADKATFEFIVTAPSHYQVISNGKLVEEKTLTDNKKRTHWKEDISLPTKVMVIGVARFAVKEYEDSPKNIPISAWVYPQDSSEGFQNYSYAPEILKFYSNWIGPYPYEKLANVQSKTIFGGMENASAIFYSEGSATSKSSVEDLLAHEIAHQWFGDMVTEKEYAHLWLSEGFVSYMTDVYLESKYGKESLTKRLKRERNDAVNFKNGQPVVDSVTTGMGLLNPNEYQKGAWILHMLRRQVGDSVFHLIIRKYYDRFRGKNADTEDFRRVVEEVTHKDFKQFFNQWLYTAGVPELELKWQYNKNNKAISVTITQKQKNGIFRFPLQIAFETKSTKEKIVSLNITKQSETFTIKSSEPVTKITLDPSVNLLFEQK